MTDPAMTAVIACTPAGVIGLDGGMPWRLSSDLRRFKSLTMGGTLVMGRKTFDSIGKPLPGRETIVLSRSASPTARLPHLHWCSSVADVLSVASGLAKPVYLVGGAEIYRLFLPYCQEIWLTRVLADIAGDTAIDLPLDEFVLISREEVAAGERDSVPTEFQRWQRKKSVPKHQLSH